MITLDFETKSEADLTKVGAWAYSEHPSTDVICACWAADDGPIDAWVPGVTNPSLWDMFDLLGQGEPVEAHNYAFELSIWINVLCRKYGWPDPRGFRWRDTMAVAAYYALPQALDRLSQVLGFGRKDPEGSRLITKYSKLYLKTSKKIIPPEDLEKWIKYCKLDVELERKVGNFLGDLPPPEQKVFDLDRVINMRGLMLDEAGINVAHSIVEQRAEKLTKEFRELTGINPTQRDKYLHWLRGNGLELPDLTAETIEDFLGDDEAQGGIDQEMIRSLEIRSQVNKASTKKLDAMLRQRGSDGRARYQTRYHGAVTGRWTGSGFQPLNLTRGFDDVSPEQLVNDVMQGNCEWLDALYGDAIDAVSKASRHWIVPAPGNKIIAGDFVSIEAIILACLAGEQWKIDAFAAGVKMYELTADKIYKLPPGTVTKKTHPKERQDGKTCELAFGFQGAVGAWRKFDKSDRHTDEEIQEHKDNWRDEHPATVNFWYDLEHAAIRAIENPSLLAEANDKIAFQTVDEWLTMILPNGKRLWYFSPELRMKLPPWHKPLTDERCAAGTCNCSPRLQVSYMAQKEGQWKRIYSYGGKWAENATQGTAREYLIPAMYRIEVAGYPIILTVYDETVSEVHKDFGSVEEYKHLLEIQEPWASGWPIKADVWEGLHYKK